MSWVRPRCSSWPKADRSFSSRCLELSARDKRTVVDSRGTFCPIPIMNLFKAYRESQDGDLIELLATDPAADPDVHAWARNNGSQVLDVAEEQGYTRILVKGAKRGA